MKKLLVFLVATIACGMAAYASDDVRQVPYDYGYVYPNDEDMTCKLGDFNWKRLGILNEYIVPEQIEIEGKSYRVVALTDRAFDGWECQVKKIVLPNTITSLPESVFGANQHMEEVVLPDGLREIPAQTFSMCTALTKIHLPANLEIIREAAFRGCTSLETLELPNTTREIHDSAFEQCIKLSTVSLSANLEYLDEDAFNLSPISEVHIPANVRKIDGNPFSCCKNLATITVDEGNQWFRVVDNVLFDKEMTEIVCYAGQKKDANYTVPSTVKTVHGKCFSRCYHINEVILPEGLETLQNRAFCQTSLKKCRIPGNTTLSEVTFDECNELEELEIAEGTKELDLYLYYVVNCPTVCLKLPEGLEKLHLSIKTDSLAIPASVKYMNVDIFPKDNQEKPVVFHMLSPTPPARWKTISTSEVVGPYWNEEYVVRVPKGCKDVYLAHPDWAGKWIFEEDEVIPTDIDEVKVPYRPATKRFENGKLVIEKDGRRFNAAGQPVW